MNNLPKIGLKVDANYFDIEKSPAKDFNVVELGSKDKRCGFNIKKLLETKKILEGKEVSMHTQTSRIFSCRQHGVPEFNAAEIKMLEAEIILCKILGAKELIFHMKVEKLDQEEEKILKKLLKFAKKNNVDMIFESNNQVIAENTLDTLKRFPKLPYNLDLGHINVGINSGSFGMPLDEFLKKIKNRLVYIHAHNNNGKEDEHKSLDEGTLDWKHVLDNISLKKVRKIIMEVRTPEGVEKTKKLLEEYLSSRKF